MLVLTRREKEKIVFPEVDIAVELVSVSRSRARIGISAPDGIRVLREELTTPEELRRMRRTPGDKVAHAIRNKLNGLSIAAALLRKQLQRGMRAEADATIDTMLRQLADANQTVTPIRPADDLFERPMQRVLLVDDDDNERHLLAGFLRMSGFHVETASDGSDALDYLASHERPDFVVLDMLMPKVDGPSTLQAIRENDHLQGLKVFALSGVSPEQFGIETGPRGVDAWFHKPCNPEELVNEINRVLEMRIVAA